MCSSARFPTTLSAGDLFVTRKHCPVAVTMTATPFSAPTTRKSTVASQHNETTVSAAPVPQSTDLSTSADSSDAALPIGVIVGSIVGAAVLAGLVTAIAVCANRRRGNASVPQEQPVPLSSNIYSRYPGAREYESGDMKTMPVSRARGTEYADPAVLVSGSKHARPVGTEYVSNVL